MLVEQLVIQTFTLVTNTFQVPDTLRLVTDPEALETNVMKVMGY